MRAAGTPPTDEVLARRRRLVSLLIGALAAVALAVGLRGGLGADRESPELRPVGMVLDAEGVYTVAGTRGNGRLLLSDGSRIIAGRGTRLRVGRVSPGALELALLNGEIFVQIEAATGLQEPGAPPPGWRISAGPYRVEASAGQLSLAWLDEQGLFAVRVEKGEARVGGPGRAGAPPLPAGGALWLDASGRALAPGRASSAAPAE